MSAAMNYEYGITPEMQVQYIENIVLPCRDDLWLWIQKAYPWGAKGTVLEHRKPAKWQKDRFTGTVRGNYYGEIEYTPTNTDNDETFGSKVLFDLDLAYELTEITRLSIGANNLLNTYPDQHTTASNRSDERFVFSRRVTQYGSNGGFYYAKLSLNLQ